MFVKEMKIHNLLASWQSQKFSCKNSAKSCPCQFTPVYLLYENVWKHHLENFSKTHNLHYSHCLIDIKHMCLLPLVTPAHKLDEALIPIRSVLVKIWTKAMWQQWEGIMKTFDIMSPNLVLRIYKEISKWIWLMTSQRDETESYAGVFFCISHLHLSSDLTTLETFQWPLQRLSSCTGSKLF